MGAIISSSNLSKAQGANKPSASSLGRNTSKRVLDLVLYLVACVTAGTGLLLAYRLPHGAGNASRVVFFGYGRHEWGDIRLFRKVSAFGCKEGWESGELTEELGVAFWAGKKSFDFKSGDHF